MENRDIWSGRMSRAHSAAIKGRISEAYWKKLQESNSRTYQYLNLSRKAAEADGVQQEASWETVTVLPGECLMRNFGEYPSVENVSTLSQILTAQVPEKYYLSPKACRGILRRAQKRGKTLPDVLRKALERQAEIPGGGVPVEYHPQDSRIRLTDDGIVQTLTGQMGTGGGNVPLVLDDQGGANIHVGEDDLAPTLRAEMHGHPPVTMQIRQGCDGGGKGALLQVDKSAAIRSSYQQTLFEPVSIDMYNQNTSEVAPTIRAGNGGDSRACVCAAKKEKMVGENCMTPWDVQSRRIYGADGTWPSLYAGEGGGHGYAAIPINDKATRHKGGGSTRNEDGAGNGLEIGEQDDPSYTLTAADRHAVAYSMDKASYNQGENARFGIGLSEEAAQTITAGWQPPAVAYDCRNDRMEVEKSGTLQAKSQGGHSLNYQNPVAVPDISGTLTAKMAKGTGGPAGDECQNLVAQAPEYIVRRLTPLECCRLQGFPDGWTDGLGMENPDKETVEFWESVFEEHRRLTGSPKNRRSRNQVIKWIRDPYSDTALYRMWGNGISLPCAAFVMKGVVMELMQ